MPTTFAEPQTTPVPLLEVAFSLAPRVDRDAGIIREVKILGRESHNGRVYSDAALEQATAMYEGLAVNIDHPDQKLAARDRKFADGFGYLQNVMKRSDGVYGDLVYLKSHALAEQVCEAAERMPRQLGLSHNAEGYVISRHGKTIVEGIARIHSVDLVRNPASNRGLFESVDESSDAFEENAAAASEPDAAEPSKHMLADLQEKVRQLESEREVYKLLESAGVAPHPVKIRALMALGTAAERKALIETWPRHAPRGKPRSSGSLREPTFASALPTDGASFARAIR